MGLRLPRRPLPFDRGAVEEQERRVGHVASVREDVDTVGKAAAGRAELGLTHVLLTDLIEDGPETAHRVGA